MLGLGDRLSEPHGVNDGDEGVDFDGLAVEDGWAIAPLAHRVEGGLVEEGIAADRLQSLNTAVRSDDGVKLDAAFAANLYRQGRVDWLDAVNEHRGLYVSYDNPNRHSSHFCWPLRLGPRIVDGDGTGDLRTRSTAGHRTFNRISRLIAAWCWRPLWNVRWCTIHAEGGKVSLPRRHGPGLWVRWPAAMVVGWNRHKRSSDSFRFAK